MSAARNVHRFVSLGTTCVVVTSSPRALEQARRTVEGELDAVDCACSRFRDDSELVRLNRSAGAPMPVSPLLFEALRFALRAACATDGLVDPTVGRSLRACGYDQTFAVVRTNGRLSLRPTGAKGPGWTSITLDNAQRTVSLPPGVELDLGATAKALAADRAARLAAESTKTGVLVSLGGDVAVAGESPLDGWSIRIDSDNAAPLDGAGPQVAISSGGVATSGTTVRRWTTAAGEFHHIIDPRTGLPAVSPWRTVSVAAASCVDANTASTAAIVLADRAPAWLAARRLPARLVRADGATTFVGGWPEDRA